MLHLIKHFKSKSIHVHPEPHKGLFLTGTCTIHVSTKNYCSSKKTNKQIKFSFTIFKISCGFDVYIHINDYLPALLQIWILFSFSCTSLPVNQIVVFFADISLMYSLWITNMNSVVGIIIGSIRRVSARRSYVHLDQFYIGLCQKFQKFKSKNTEIIIIMHRLYA